jgi:2-phospho-L-lactate/phosphoenolpyruvate guanylyltransferase
MIGPSPAPALLAALPLKPFAAAKGRLDGVLDPPARAALSREAAGRVAQACAGAGLPVAVVTSDSEVAAWARGMGLEIVPEPPGGGLDGAAWAAAEVALSRGQAWCIVHGDLPLLTPDDVDRVARAFWPGRAVLAPSRNGGTNLFAAGVPLPFAYGPRSFSRHLFAARHLEHGVVVTVGTALDLDTPEDLRGAAALPGGAWLRPYLT